MPWHRRVHSVWVGNLPGKGEGKLTKRRKPWVVLSSKLKWIDSPNWRSIQPRTSWSFIGFKGGHDLKGCYYKRCCGLVFWKRSWDIWHLWKNDI